MPTKMLKFIKSFMKTLSIIGGGLAGSEAAWQAAKRGIHVDLYEMRPDTSTGAHVSGDLAELVCSNSLGSLLPDRPSGMLIHEMEKLDSLIIKAARKSNVPAGHAFAVDRQKFSSLITKALNETPNIKIIREEITQFPQKPCIIATGPLTSSSFAQVIQDFTESENLFFFDAIAPTIDSETVDMSIAFWGSRYSKNTTSEGDYLNCPFSKEEYDIFVIELTKANRYPIKDFEEAIESGVKAGKGHFFEGCLPIEVMANRGHRTLAFGPLRPVGLTNPHLDKKPYAVAQLRREDQEGRYLNLVGFQTNLIQKEQQRVFRLIPGLSNAIFTKFGQMHKNTFIFSTDILNSTLISKKDSGIFFAGQICGVEGYLASAATGILAGINAARFLCDQELVDFPPETMIGALCHRITHSENEFFQPVKESFGILPPLDPEIKAKKLRHQKLYERELEIFNGFFEKIN
jgi:methylenetetrahydrofolate--tRNA-(uracil-5-)-methyltransferase